VIVEAAEPDLENLDGVEISFEGELCAATATERFPFGMESPTDASEA
jgi:hypothetical protein